MDACDVYRDHTIDSDDGCEAWVAWTRLVDTCEQIGVIPPERKWYVDYSVMMYGAVMHVNSATYFDPYQARTALAYFPSLSVSFHANDNPNIIYEKTCELRSLGIFNISIWTMHGDSINYSPI